MKRILVAILLGTMLCISVGAEDFAITRPVKLLVPGLTTFGFTLFRAKLDGSCCSTELLTEINFGALNDDDGDGFLSALPIYGIAEAFSNGKTYEVNSTMASMTAVVNGSAETFDDNSIGVQTVSALGVDGNEISGDSRSTSRSAIGTDLQLYQSNADGSGGSLQFIWYIPSFDGAGSVPFSNAIIPSKDVPQGEYASSLTLSMTITS
ncbi:MAG: hypothetical protein ACI9CF_002000 [Candidatus Omnitrophota bacterium]|jgi:hypothetical protein